MVMKKTSVMIFEGEIKQICSANINPATGNVELGRCTDTMPHVATTSVYANNTIIGHADTKMIGDYQIYLMKPGDLFDKKAFEKQQKEEWKKVSEEVGYD